MWTRSEYANVFVPGVCMHEFRLTPIFVIDEIDAALDFKNVPIIALIIISLKNNIVELCDRLIEI